jgi:hypothetical protein
MYGDMNTLLPSDTPAPPLPTVESSVFGAEFDGMKNVIETCHGLHYKLRMMGVPLSGPIVVYGDNIYVVHNTRHPEYVLKKKSNSS